MNWVLKTSAVRAATSRGDETFDSLEEMPPELRRQARKALDGPHTETILIANQEAYDRVLRGDSDLPSEFQRLRSAASGGRHNSREGHFYLSRRQAAVIAGAAAAIMGALVLALIRSGTS